MKANYFAELLIKRKVTVDNLVSFLKKHNLLTLLPGVLDYLKHKEAQHLEHNTLVIETPFDLNDKSLEFIKNKIGSDALETDVVIKDELLAGYVARFRGVEYDHSAKTVIENFVRN